MKHLAFALIFCSIVAAIPLRAADKKSDPSQYPLTVHVSASQIDSAGSFLVETVTVIVGGKHYLLRGNPVSGSLLDPGDYRARLLTDSHKTNYLTSQEYELLFPDGATWKCGLAGESE